MINSIRWFWHKNKSYFKALAIAAVECLILVCGSLFMGCIAIASILPSKED